MSRAVVRLAFKGYVLNVSLILIVIHLYVNFLSIGIYLIRCFIFHEYTALDMINNAQVQAIIGPGTSMQANFVVNVGDQAKVPILTFSASSPSLASLGSSFFFRLTQNDSIQVKAISDIVKNFGWRQVVPIFEDTSYGEGIIPFLIDALQAVEAHVPHRSVVATDDQIEIELNRLKGMPTRVFIVHMNPHLCSRLFARAKKIGMMSAGYVWIIASGISNHLSLMRHSHLNSMEGVLGIQTYIRRTLKLREFEKRWKMKFQQENPNVTKVKLDVYGFQAHDAVFGLAMAVEQVGYTSIEYQKPSDSLKATDLDAFKVSHYGKKLVGALSGVRFEGLAGDFNVVEGQLQSSTYNIINVIGGKAKEIALWTPEKRMVPTNTSKIFTNSKCIFGPIKWPGDPICVPKGWEIPTKGNKLIIGVPVKKGFEEFVKITKDVNTNTTTVKGFCIDVFLAAVKLLPYDLPHVFVPYENSNGSMAGTYDELVYEVFLKKFDAVVGDTTIRANRSLYVDFTMPYTKSDVAIVMPIKDSTRKNAWIFMKPLTGGLWLTTLCFFIFIGCVVWVLEHRINEDFRGPPSHQVGTSIWFSFSTMVFSHRERVVSNLARFVMIIWVFVMLIVTQSYTASLSSLLTVQQLMPTVTDLSDLLRNGDDVGYIENAFVREVLYEIGFNNTRLRVIKSAEDGDKELTKGTAKGGIAAFVGGTPLLKVFVAKYCSKYTIIGPISKTNGFAFVRTLSSYCFCYRCASFKIPKSKRSIVSNCRYLRITGFFFFFWVALQVFPKRSPLVADMSSAILNLTEGKEILNLEATWLGNESICQGSSSANMSGNSLGLESFWGLFLIAGVASVLALIIFFSSFLYEHKHVLMPSNSRASIWRRIHALIEIFDDRDASSYTFRSSQPSNKIVSVGDHGPNASPISNWPECPFSYTNHGDLDPVFGGQQTPSTGGASPEPVPTIELAITI
ncbi:putative periplasmic binding protein-like I [Rosa chinensis]|uniref:Glutamate receptor n=1 Tax=Rosa chinensis TaxID=74649 RepID=A0A2P6PQL1_ROSCH|nr:putative periplasmic binding protein-like I [Rosa chinensis]